MVDSDARYRPSSASFGTTCFGDRSRYSGEFTTSSTFVRSAGVSAFARRLRGPARPSSPPSAPRHRWVVRSVKPSTSQACSRRAPAATASSMSPRITSRSRRRVRRPRPPRGRGLFLEHEQRGRLGERLVLAPQLTFQVLDALALRTARRGLRRASFERRRCGTCQRV